MYLRQQIHRVCRPVITPTLGTKNTRNPTEHSTGIPLESRLQDDVETRGRARLKTHLPVCDHQTVPHMSKDVHGAKMLLSPSHHVLQQIVQDQPARVILVEP